MFHPRPKKASTIYCFVVTTEYRVCLRYLLAVIANRYFVNDVSEKRKVLNVLVYTKFAKISHAFERDVFESSLNYLRYYLAPVYGECK